MAAPHTLVVGAGIFGVTAALELRRRGHRVTLLDAGPIPHPLAASTDISKVCRMEYGADETYMAFMERARDGWMEWNAKWVAEGTGPLYHETGVVMACQGPMRPGGFEYESYQRLRARGHRPERLDAHSLAERFPAWSTGRYVDGFFHAKGGYAASGRVVTALLGWARQAGVELIEGRKLSALWEASGRIRGVVDEAGERIAADGVVIAAGAWTAKLVPGLSSCFRATGHPVFHLKPDRPELFQPDRFPVFTADVATSGYYGFPLMTSDRIVKIATHSLGRTLDPDARRTVSQEEEADLRSFLDDTFPDLARAPIVYTRLCLYADTWDEDFWIARDPEREGLTVASGGSGHGFKFAPVLGSLIADAVEGRTHSLLEKFRWRPEVRLNVGREAARCHVRK